MHYIEYQNISAILRSDYLFLRLQQSKKLVQKILKIKKRSKNFERFLFIISENFNNKF